MKAVLGQLLVEERREEQRVKRQGQLGVFRPSHVGWCEATWRPKRSTWLVMFRRALRLRWLGVAGASKRHTPAARMARLGYLGAAAAVGATCSAPMWLSPVHLEADEAMTQPAMVHDRATSLSLPSTMSANGRTLQLVGLGVRTVTFLRVHVYLAGVYVEETALSRAAPHPLDLETQFAQWLDEGVPCAVRIKPVRGTDFSHLRDGLIRAVNVRAKDARAAASPYALTDAGEKALDRNIRDLKALFPRKSVTKGQLLDLIVQHDVANQTYALTVQFDEQPIGTVLTPESATTDARRSFALPMHMLLAYVGVRPGISTALRTSIAEHLQ